MTITLIFLSNTFNKKNFVFVVLQIDSIMSTRLATENDASRRLKSEFLIQFDGVTSNPDDLVIVIGKFGCVLMLFMKSFV